MICSDAEIFITEFFDSLKLKVDLHFTQLNEESSIDNWLNIIECLEINQQVLTELAKTQSLVSFTNELELLKSNQDEKQLELIQFRIESTIMQSTSLLFYKNYRGKDLSFLVFVEDQYIPQGVSENFSYKHLNKDLINMHFLEDHLDLLFTADVFSNQDVYAVKHSLNLKSLTTCSLSNKGIESIDSDLFQNMPNIEEIDFSNNMITVLHKELFDNLTKLREIDFSCNSIKMLPIELFDSLDHFQTRVRFLNNELEYIDPIILYRFDYGLNFFMDE